MKLRTALSAGGAVALSAFFLWLALRRVEFDALGRALASARWGWIPVMAGIAVVDTLIRALRWRVLLRRAKPEGASVWTLFKLEAIGLAVNNVLFARLGEFARAALAARRLALPTVAVLASVAIERALDVAALVAMFLVAARLRPEYVRPGLVPAAATLLAAAVGALVLLAAAEGALEPGRPAEKLLRRWPRIHSLAEQLTLGAAVLRSPAAAAQAALFSLALWAVDGGLYWIAARAMRVEQFMDYPQAVLTLAMAGLSSALPVAPGAIGTFEHFVATLLQSFGASAEPALAYALVTHMVMYLVVTVAGLVFLSREGVSLAQLREEAGKR